jgi:hypothetical protein
MNDELLRPEPAAGQLLVLPLREFLEFEAIWPVRPFENFLEDCRTHFGAKEVNV